MKKRVWSILLVLCMVLCLVPTAAWAAGDADITGTGSTQDPYLIYTAQGLKTFRDKVNNYSQRDANAKLMNDIVLNDGSFDENGNWSESGTPEQWTPISNYYRGTFDGNGKTIRGLYINGLNDHCGLFGMCGSCCTIRNLTVTGYVCASANMSVGGIVGFAGPNTYITNCQNSCTVKGGDRVGGIAGAASSNSLISGCSNSGRISGIAAVGGIVGDLWGISKIENCSNIGAVTGTGDEVYVGGLAGRSSDSEISNSYSVGALSGSGNQVYVGGIAGETSGRNGHYSCWLEDTAEEAAGYGTAFKNLYARSKSDFADGTVLNLLKQKDTENAWNSCGYLAAAGMTLPLLSWQTADDHEHNYQWQYDDNAHWKVCACNMVQPDSKAAHSAEEGICTSGIYCACGYEMYPATMDHNWSDWEHELTTHARTCQNPGCSATQTNHCTGGTATCQQQAICTVCNQPYGSYDSNNHTGTLQWNRTNNTHEQVWSCCGAIVVQEDHHWADGVCTDCGWSCSHSAPGMSVYDENHDHKCDLCGQEVSQHTGGMATCIAAAKCEVCGESYGDVDMHNHADLQYFPAKAATQAEAGNTEYWYCSGCGKYYTNNDLTEEITRDDTVIPKLPEENKPGETKPAETKPAETKPATTKPTETKTTTKKTTEKTIEKTTAAKSPRTGAGATQGALLLTGMAGAGVLLLGCKKRRLYE